ncbi:MAG TPA: MgtC/SapB family protein [Thermoanaerobaculia bacterium]
MSAQLQILAEVALAMVLGAALGLERELAGKPAGLRTHMLIAGAAALLVGLTDVLVARFATTEGSRVDPIRVIEATVAAVGFLGAGTILRRPAAERVEGLTTAASLLLAAALGICVALRQFLLAGGVVILTLATLRILGSVEDWFSRRGKR